MAGTSITTSRVLCAGGIKGLCASENGTNKCLLLQASRKTSKTLLMLQAKVVSIHEKNGEKTTGDLESLTGTFMIIIYLTVYRKLN